jgi:ketosteroid isomerase-like protein
MSQENVEVIRGGWNAWLRGDLQGLFETFAPDVVWDTSHFRDWPEAAYYGTDGVQRFLSEWLEVWDEYEVTVEELIAVPDGRVLSLMRHRGRGRASGVPMDLPMAQIATLRDGKVIRLDNYDDRVEALETVGLRE